MTVDELIQELQEIKELHPLAGRATLAVISDSDDELYLASIDFNDSYNLVTLDLEV